MAERAGFSGEWGGMRSDLQQWLKRCMDNISRWWRRWRRSDPRQRALRHPPSFPLFPHPQSLRRPCLRGRRGSSTIENGSAAEWWRGVIKPITTPINPTQRGILSGWICVKTPMSTCVSDCVRGHGGWWDRLHLTMPFNEPVMKRELLFSPGCCLLSSTIQT